MERHEHLLERSQVPATPPTTRTVSASDSYALPARFCSGETNRSTTEY